MVSINKKFQIFKKIIMNNQNIIKVQFYPKLKMTNNKINTFINN